MDGAAAWGHLAMVQYLHYHRSEGCTTNAMDNAARWGHLDIVRFLHEHRLEGATRIAMFGAVAGGYLDIVRYLHEHYHLFCGQDLLGFAEERGHHHVKEALVAMCESLRSLEW